MSLQFFDYNGLKLTVPEIRLLKLVESRRAAHRQVEEEKRAERILLSQSLQSSMLMGMHMVCLYKTDFVSFCKYI